MGRTGRRLSTTLAALEARAAAIAKLARRPGLHTIAHALHAAALENA
jgi:hypothetical protein